MSKGAYSMSRKRPISVCMILFLGLMTACQTETLVTKVDPTKPGKQTTEGVLFSLPETLIVTEVPLTKVTSSPGTYSEWTEFFYPQFTADDYTTEQNTTVKIGPPLFTTRGQTDPKNVYHAPIKVEQIHTKTVLFD